MTNRKKQKETDLAEIRERDRLATIDEIKTIIVTLISLFIFGSMLLFVGLILCGVIK